MKTIEMQLDGISINLMPYDQHEFIMSGDDVALGYGISPNTLKGHKSNHKDEIFEGTHFLKGVKFPSATHIPPNKTYWTRQGVIRMGFFVKSERAIKFRNWIERMVIDQLDKKVKAPALPAPPVRSKHVKDVLILDLMQDIIQIKDHDLRMSISQKLMALSLTTQN